MRSLFPSDAGGPLLSVMNDSLLVDKSVDASFLFLKLSQLYKEMALEKSN